MGVWNRRCCCGPGCIGVGVAGDCTAYTCPDDMIPYWPASISFRFTNYFSHGWGVALNLNLQTPAPRCTPDITGEYDCTSYSAASWQVGTPSQESQSQVVTLNKDPGGTESKCLGGRDYGGIYTIVYPSGVFPSFGDNPWGVPAEDYGTASTYWASGRDYNAWPVTYYQLVHATLSYTASLVGGRRVATARLKINMGARTTDPAAAIVYGSTANSEAVFVGHADTTNNTGCYCGAPTAAIANMTLDASESAYATPTAPTTATAKTTFNGFADTPPAGPCDWCAEYGRGGSCDEDCDEATIGGDYMGNEWNYWQTSPGQQYERNGMFLQPWSGVSSCSAWGSSGDFTNHRTTPNEGYASCDDAAIGQVGHWATPDPASSVGEGGKYTALSDMSIVL